MCTLNVRLKAEESDQLHPQASLDIGLDAGAAVQHKTPSASNTKEHRKDKKSLQARDDGQASGDEDVDGDAEVGDVHIDLSADWAERDVDFDTRIEGNRNFLAKTTIKKDGKTQEKGEGVQR